MTESSTPEVSVVMSCHNASRWLREAADSVLSQTLKEFEFLLIDDGSKDDTWDIIETYRNRDPRIVAVAKTHSGLADSLNVGVSRSRGTWIARIDADDLWEPNRLEKQIRFARKNPDVVLIGTNFLLTNADGVILKRIRCPSTHRGLLWNLEHLQRFFPHSSALFKRDLAQSAGAYNPWNRLSEDSDLWLRFAESGRIACLDDFLVRCRKHPAQISNTRAGGSPQLVYGMAGAVSHFLRVRDFPDPSRGTDESAWNEFVAWIDRRVQEEGIPAYHQAWARARGAYFGSSNRFAGALTAAIRLISSGQALPLLGEKLFGLSLPKRLADEWIGRPRVASRDAR